MYRTLDVLEELGYLHHSHGADGREEFHVLPHAEHAHLRCERVQRVVGDRDRRRPMTLVDGPRSGRAGSASTSAT